MGKLKKTEYELSKRDKKLLELMKIAGQIIIREDRQLFKELAKC